MEGQGFIVFQKWEGTESVVEGFSPKNPDLPWRCPPVQHSKIRSRLKAQLTHFTAELTAGLSKPLRNFVAEMLFGIQASQDVKLSNIARRLQEEIPLLKTEDRLSRNLQAEELETQGMSLRGKRFGTFFRRPTQSPKLQREGAIICRPRSKSFRLNRRNFRPP